jgi:hypothetical protein
MDGVAADQAARARARSTSSRPSRVRPHYRGSAEVMAMQAREPNRLLIDEDDDAVVASRWHRDRSWLCSRRDYADAVGLALDRRPGCIVRPGVQSRLGGSQHARGVRKGGPVRKLHGRRPRARHAEIHGEPAHRGARSAARRAPPAAHHAPAESHRGRPHLSRPLRPHRRGGWIPAAIAIAITSARSEPRPTEIEPEPGK